MISEMHGQQNPHFYCLHRNFKTNEVCKTKRINLRGVSTNKTIICFIAMQTYKELKTNEVCKKAYLWEI
jgi:hypothetical protein